MQAEMNIKADTMEENFVQAVDIKDFHVDVSSMLELLIHLLCNSYSQ